MSREAERVYDIAEAAELKSVSPGYIRAAIKATAGNVLEAVNIGSPAQPRYRIKASELDAWFDRMSPA